MSNQKASDALMPYWLWWFLSFTLAWANLLLKYDCFDYGGPSLCLVMYLQEA